MYMSHEVEGHFQNVIITLFLVLAHLSFLNQKKLNWNLDFLVNFQLQERSEEAEEKVRLNLHPAIVFTRFYEKRQFKKTYSFHIHSSYFYECRLERF